MSGSQNPDDNQFLQRVQEVFPQMKPKIHQAVLQSTAPPIPLSSTSPITLRVFIPHQGQCYDIELQPENVPAVGDALVYRQGEINISGVVTMQGVLIDVDDMNRETKFVSISFSETVEILRAVLASNFARNFGNPPNSSSETKPGSPDSEIPASEPKTDPN